LYTIIPKSTSLTNTPPIEQIGCAPLHLTEAPFCSSYTDTTPALHHCRPPFTPLSSTHTSHAGATRTATHTTPHQRNQIT
jgi:hypothetical protein